jgi:hypothetical protein
MLISELNRVAAEAAKEYTLIKAFGFGNLGEGNYALALI